ncbi:MAG: STAS domain protein [Methanoregula sp. PtaU1.Bin051]|nr:MAG: STAS domain protein [Methanoregula sp. PtaU1.Bin051]
MAMQFERQNGILIVRVDGRLDAFGANELNVRIRDALHDDDRALLLDLASCQYLSSGGIRVFLAYQREMQRRQGGFALAGVQEYPEKVLDIAGFTCVFGIYPSVDAAMKELSRFLPGGEPGAGPHRQDLSRNNVTFTEAAGLAAGASLHIIGDLNNVLYSRITEHDIRLRRFSEIEYSLGLGALGVSVADAMPVLGEMITLHGSMVWLPTDGHNTPDFLTPQDPDRGDVLVYTGFAATLRGSFSEYLTVTCGDEPLTLTGLYRLIFTHAKKRPGGFSGIVAVALLGIVDGIASTGVKRSPVRANAPADGSSIMSPPNLSEWVATDTRYTYTGDTLVSFGIGIDLSSDLSAFDSADVSALSYINPANRGDQEMYLHNHGVVFRNVPYDDTRDLNSQIRTIVSEGEFLDMRHLLDSTRIRRAKAGIAYIQSIEREL